MADLRMLCYCCDSFSYMSHETKWRGLLDRNMTEYSAASSPNLGTYLEQSYSPPKAREDNEQIIPRCDRANNSLAHLFILNNSLTSVFRGVKYQSTNLHFQLQNLKL